MVIALYDQEMFQGSYTVSILGVIMTVRALILLFPLRHVLQD